MAGLLDFMKSPEGQGLLSAAFGGLAGARRGTPLNNLGRGGLAGLAGYTGAQDRQAEELRTAQQRQMFDMRAAEMRDAQQAKQKQQEYFQTLNPSAASRNTALMGGGGPTVENAAKIQPADPRKQQMWELAANGVIPVSDYIKSEVMPQAPEYKVVGNSLVSIGRDGVKEAYKPEERIDPNKPFMYQNGQVLPNPAYQQFELEKASRGASRTNVRVENKMGESIAKEVGPILKDSRDAANGAAKMIDSADRIIKAVDTGKIYAGPGASMRLKAAQIGQVLGVGGADYAERIASTRQTIRGLAEMTLEGRKTMRGQGAVTDSEGALAERAMSGNIDGFTAAEIKQLANASARSARFIYDQHGEMLGNVEQNPGTKGLASFYRPFSLPNSNVGIETPAASGGWSIQEVK